MSRKERYACGNQKVLRSFKLYKMDLQKFKCSQDAKLELKCDIKPVAKSVQQPSLEVKPGTQIVKKEKKIFKIHSLLALSHIAA
jgi:hypothetical protein